MPDNSAGRQRVYVRVDTPMEKGKEVSGIFGRKCGVMLADVLQDQSGVMVLIEAGHRKQLVARTVQAITSVELLTTGVRLLPVQTKAKPHAVCAI